MWSMVFSPGVSRNASRIPYDFTGPAGSTREAEDIAPRAVSPCGAVLIGQDTQMYGGRMGPAGRGRCPFIKALLSLSRGLDLSGGTEAEEPQLHQH